MCGDFDAMRPLFSLPQTVAARIRLCSVASRMASMTAIVLHDTGDHREATGWFHTAKQAAEEAEDTRFHAWIIAREAMVPLNYGAPQAAARAAEEASHRAGNQPSAAATLAAAVQARAYAAQGRRTEALAAVDDAERLMDQLLPEDQVDTWFGYPEQKHHVHLSQALTLLGETKRAAATQARVLELTHSPSLMTRALIAIDQAACLAHDGHPDEAARIATQAYGQLPASYRTGLTKSRAICLYRSLPPTTAGLDGLRDALAA
jgi:hypothetical protein